MILLLTTTFVLSVLFVYLIMKNASFLGLEDIPNARSSHKNVIPRSAGLGFVSAVLISTGIFEFPHLLTYSYIYISILFVMLVGLYDDKMNISHRVKFIALLLVAIYVCANGIRIDTLGVYFNYNIALPIWIAAPFTVIAIVGFTNALNLTDGLDGLAGSLSLIMLLAFFTIGIVHNDQLLIILSSTFIVSILAFLIFNWDPAKIFMGDSGSLSLGLVISILSIHSLEYIAPSAMLFIIALPLIDTFIVMRRRIQRHQSPFIADKNHIHHIMYKMKVNVRVSVMLLLYIQLALTILGYQIRQENQIVSLALFILLLYILLNLFDQRFRYRKKGLNEKNWGPKP